jgi:hypothetical protein
MGVHATFCQLCGLPVQHDHYVPAASGPMLKIYRGGEPGGGHEWEPGEVPFPFGPAHAWLLDAVLVRTEDEPLHGRVSDGGLATEDGDEEYVGDGSDEGLVFHRACWQRLGEPRLGTEARTTRGTHALALVAPYQEQLFEFAELAADGKGWMLEDPATSARSAARLEALVTSARVPTGKEASTLADLLRLDDDWSAVAQREGDAGQRARIVRRRRGLREVDRTGYGDAVWVDLAYPAGAVTGDALDAVEVALKATVEAGAQGVLVAAAQAPAESNWLVYARDGQATAERLRGLTALTTAGTPKVEVQPDPRWTNVFGEQG